MQAITLSSMGIVFVPILIVSLVAVIIGFLKKNLSNSIYRILIALWSFWIFYYLIPAMILQNAGLTAQLSMVANSSFSAWMKLYTLSFANFLYSVALFLAFPIVMYPFVYIISPFISVVILIFYIGRKNITQVSLWADFKVKPSQFLAKEEKEMLKMFLALLPFSIYLLTTIIQIMQIPEDPLTLGRTTLGWFLEIYLMYLLAFIISFHLLASVRVYFQNKFIGERIRDTAFRTILIVSIILSTLSLYSYIIQNPETLYLLLFFSSYYIMTAIIFIMLFRFFEPASAYILVKIISLIKDFRAHKDFFKTLPIAIVLGVVLGVAVLGYYYLIVIPISIQITPSRLLTDILLFSNPRVDDIIYADLILGLSNFWLYFDYGIVVIGALFFIRKYKTKPLHILIPVYIFRELVSLYFPSGKHYWITSVFSLALLGDEYVLFPRFALLEIDFGFLEQNYLVKSAVESFLLVFDAVGLFGSIIILSIIGYLHMKDVVQVTAKGEARLKRILGWMHRPNGGILQLRENTYIIPIIKGKEEIELTEEETKLYDFVKSEIPKVSEVKEKSLLPQEEIPNLLKNLWTKHVFSFLEEDVYFEIPLTRLVGLYVVMKDGRGVYSKSFGKVEVGSELVSGMLSAITSFVKETTRSSDYLRLIDHGDIVLLIEYGTYVFVALLAERETPEIRMRLKGFLKEFEQRYGDKLIDWTGDLREFTDCDEIVKNYFERPVI